MKLTQVDIIDVVIVLIILIVCTMPFVIFASLFNLFYCELAAVIILLPTVFVNLQNKKR